MRAVAPLPHVLMICCFSLALLQKHVFISIPEFSPLPWWLHFNVLSLLSGPQFYIMCTDDNHCGKNEDMWFYQKAEFVSWSYLPFQLGIYVCVFLGKSVECIFFCFVSLNMLISWASGALDPDSSSTGDLVTSVKRYVVVCFWYIWLWTISFRTSILSVKLKIILICFVFHRGIWAMIVVFLTYCLLQAPST